MSSYKYYKSQGRDCIILHSMVKYNLITTNIPLTNHFSPAKSSKNPAELSIILLEFNICSHHSVQILGRRRDEPFCREDKLVLFQFYL